VPKASPTPAPVTTPPPPAPEPAPRWQLGPLLRATASLGLAPAGLRGAGAGLGLDARAPTGLLIAADIPWLTQAQGPLRLSRLRALCQLCGSCLAGPGLRRPLVHLPTGNATLGGLELNLGREIGVWLPVGPGQKRRSKRTGP